MNFLSADHPELKKLDVFVDLDQLESRKTGFKLHGKGIILRPVSLIDHLKLANAAARLDAVRTKEVVAPADITDIYWSLFELACENMTREDFGAMTIGECEEVCKLIMETAISRIPVEAAQKKSPLIPKRLQ